MKMIARQQQGFTLIEVLLVVLLIGIVSGIVLLAASPNDSSRVVATETERLAEVLVLASEEAINNNQQMGLLFDERSYRLMVLDETSQRWQESNEPLFAAYELPEIVNLHLLKDDKDKLIVLDKDKNNKQDDTQAITPQLLFLSSGESSSVVLEIASEDGNKQQISVDDLSSVTLGSQAPVEQSR
ncbi:MAG TPA: type II secretion system minor pseudopilin GspH [Agitococcus sp.]|jgi:general secretion pathway protein H|nr:type II secretion system minor pseudopilin GspH [Agitococcus sp.]HNB19095.1 type II secretion system minor pseudopilin GspH [Agitococcus sp.]HNG46337.1 type II secretion system minor pseudopilin GspH [Agitococcus sp.]HNJ86209.1 type II secretion system minor pseudopilin GspH [Agitococcus sp.]HNL35659.1 type II secretion system minor pseudopilin GspH [Agitococcus sp.]